MKKRRFYDNKIGYRKQTEEPEEAEFDFSEQETVDEDEEIRKKLFSKDSISDRRRRSQKSYSVAVTVICGILLVLTGFIGADVYMIRHASPISRISEQNEEKEEDEALNEIQLSFAGAEVPSISLDGSLMLSSVIEDMHKSGKTAVVFDAKRADGTIGYESTLSTVETLGLKSSQGTKPRESVNQLIENDLLPIARIYVYLDNAVPLKSSEMALKKDKKNYTDSDGNTYMNPESELVYGYIKEVVSELQGYGISIFILDGCEIDGKDYFDDISAKLSKEIGGKLRFYKAVNVKLTGYDAESGDVNAAGIRHGIEKFPNLKNNQVYIIKTDLKENRFIPVLTQKKINRYVVTS